jgi:ATP-dependent RNA helicase RhlE
MESKETPSTFEGLGISDAFMKVLAALRFSVPTPIQHKAIPAAVRGEDIIGIAQTGTGKTLAFGVPMLQQLYEGTKTGIGLVVLPTRELALQVDEVFEKLGKPLGLRTAILIGGENIRKQITQLRARPHVLIVTPGRLLDLLEQKQVRVDKVAILVLDEADRMLDMGFAPQINRIMELLPPPAQRQTMLFSATMPDDIVRIANTHMRMPVRVEVAPQGTTAENVSQELYIVRKEDKLRLVAELLVHYTGPVLLFSRTKHGAHKICKALTDIGISAAEIHANKSLVQRIKALDGFKKGLYRVLVATDIAARGIDVTNIELVINFDLPDNAGDYVHRIGRTARAGRTGTAISLATPDQRTEIRDIERIIRKPLPLKRHPKLSVEIAAVPIAQRGLHGGRVRHFGNRRPRFRR